MTKYITVAALLAAGTAFANAATETTTLDVAFPAFTDAATSWVNADGLGYANTTTAINVTNILGSKAAGIYYGCGNAGAYETAKNDLTVNTTTETVSFVGRPAKGAEWMALVYDLSSITSAIEVKGIKLENVESLNFGYSTASSTNPASSNWSFSAWTLNSENSATLLGNAPTNQNFTVKGTNSYTYSWDAISSQSEIVFLWNASHGTPIISDITFTVTAVPEPSAFGLLAGIGALALVASRRRRK